MVDPVGPSLKTPLAAVPRLPELPALLARLEALFAAEAPSLPPGDPGRPREDEALFAQIVPRDPGFRSALLQAVEQRLNIPSDIETACGLVRLRDLLLRAPEPAAAAGAPAAPGTSVVPEAAALAERILRASRQEPGQGVTRLRLRLSPPELGELRVDLSVRRKSLRAALHAERPEAAAAILAELPSLREALERRGFEIDELSVNAPGDAPPEAAAPPRIMDLEA